MSETIISLTTIPPRINTIALTLQSLLDQEAKINRIVLCIPRRYRRTDLGEISIPDLPAGIEVLRCDHDYGPATKVLPVIKEYRGSDARIIYCDDDRIYHPDWAANLLQKSDENNECCIADDGEKIEVTALNSVRNTTRYRVLKAATFGLYGRRLRKVIRGLDPGIGWIDIAKGYGGVLVRPEFIPETAFDIPDTLWVVDDIWLSGQLALNNVKIIKATRVPNSSKREVADVQPLFQLVHEDLNRNNANLAGVRYFQETSGIWTDREIRADHILASASVPGRRSGK